MLHKIYNAEPVAPFIEIPRHDQGLQTLSIHDHKFMTFYGQLYIIHVYFDIIFYYMGLKICIYLEILFDISCPQQFESLFALGHIRLLLLF